MKPTIKNPHAEFSQTREKMFEHLFVGELMRVLWKRAPEMAGTIQVLFSEVDNAGFDVALQYRGVTRFVQLKASIPSRTKSFPINKTLQTLRGSCVVLMEIDEKDLSITRFRWRGSDLSGAGIDPRKCCSLEGLKMAKDPRTKKIRANSVSLPIGKMHVAKTISDIADRLFPPATHSNQ